MLLRSRSLLPAQSWSWVWKILAPALPLLECFASKSTQLGTELLSLFNPDLKAVLPADLLNGNVRLLFHKSVDVRNEALARLTYILLTHPDANRFLPNVSNITDTIPSDLCITSNQWDSEASAATPTLYTAETVRSLVLSLATPGVDPKVRRVTLMQLNVIAASPALSRILEANNGVGYTLEALQNSLLAAHDIDYPDAAIPAIGLLAKLCVNSIRVRRELQKDDELIPMLLRALLMFHKNEALQRDCSVLLFVLVFSDYMLGETILSVPRLIIDRYSVPILCKTHWAISPFLRQSPLVDALLDEAANSNEWQFVRFTVASLFFPDQPSSQLYKNPKLEYPALEFNSKLKLTSEDSRVLQSTDFISFFAETLYSISNATSHAMVLRSLANLQSLVILPHQQRLQSVSSQDIISCVRRFLCVAPNTEPDQRVFVAVLDTVLDLADTGISELYGWVLQQVCRPQCAFLMTLQSSEASVSLMQAVCRFIRLVVRGTLDSTDPMLRRLLNEKLESTDNPLVFLYERVVSMLDEKFERREFGK